MLGSEERNKCESLLMGDCINCHSQVESLTRHKPVKYGICDVYDVKDPSKALYRSMLGHSTQKEVEK